MTDDNAHQLFGIVLDGVDVDKRRFESEGFEAVADKCCLAASVRTVQKNIGTTI